MSLLAAADLLGYGGIEDDAEEPLVQLLIDRVEALFHAQINRSERPFAKAQTGRVEIKDSTGGPDLWLDYPVAALATVITLGYASPWDESLDPSATSVISYQVGSRRVSRVDGGKFGALGRPNYVRVTYDTADELPEDVRLAIMRVTAAVWRESGGGEATSERVLPDTEALPLAADADPFWQAALASHWEPRV